MEQCFKIPIHYSYFLPTGLWPNSCYGRRYKTLYRSHIFFYIANNPIISLDIIPYKPLSFYLFHYINYAAGHDDSLAEVKL
jgi:hypothetical protein